MDIALKGLIGGVIIAAILLAARSGKPVMAGLLVSIPAITLISFYMIGQSEGIPRLQEIVKSSIIAVPTWLIFMTLVYLLLPHLGLYASLGIALAVWFLLAGVYLLLAR